MYLQNMRSINLIFETNIVHKYKYTPRMQCLADFTWHKWTIHDDTWSGIVAVNAFEIIYFFRFLHLDRKYWKKSYEYNAESLLLTHDYVCSKNTLRQRLGFATSIVVLSDHITIITSNTASSSSSSAFQVWVTNQPKINQRSIGIHAKQKQ